MPDEKPDRCDRKECGKQFTHPGLIVEQYGNRYCSYECLDQSKATQR